MVEANLGGIEEDGFLRHPFQHGAIACFDTNLLSRYLAVGSVPFRCARRGDEDRGVIAGLIACYRGLTISGGGAKAVGNAVNETVVYAFMALFVVNVVVTAIGIQMTDG